MKTAHFLWNKKGFTLVELLIVIALIGILVIAVLSAINPLEQINRARDTAFKNDTEALLSSLDRYYTFNQSLPWTVLATGASQLNCVAADTSTDPGAGASGSPGICGPAANCTSDGPLITSQELKPQFRNRTFITPGNPYDNIIVCKGTGASDSIFGCFIPLSKTERGKTTVVNISEGEVTNAGWQPGLTSCTYAGDADNVGWNAVATACEVCLPQ